MYNICKCLQDPKRMLKLLKTDLDRERLLNRSFQWEGLHCFDGEGTIKIFHFIESSLNRENL